jgi:hypothetical protein
MSKESRLSPDEGLAIVRSLALRQHVSSLSPQKQEVVSMLFGIGCGRLDVAAVASRLDCKAAEVRQMRDAALQELGAQAATEAAA